jgi:cell division protein FtsB
MAAAASYSPGTMSRPELGLRLAYERAGSHTRQRVSAPVIRNGLPSSDPSSAPWLDRRLLVLIGLGVVLVWLVVVFGRAVADSKAATERVEQARAENAVIERRLEARQAELKTIQSPAFVALQARTYGLGSPREQPFGLEAGAPPPPDVPLVGEEPAAAAPSSPLDDWLELLFGP